MDMRSYSYLAAKASRQAILKMFVTNLAGGYCVVPVYYHSQMEGMWTINSLEAYFEGFDESRRLFERLMESINTLEGVQIRVTKSQVGFWRKKAFAYAWIPARYLHGKTAPLVLTVGLRRRDPSPRWKEVVEPHPGRFTHHLELYLPDDLDGEAENWLLEAWQQAG